MSRKPPALDLAFDAELQRAALRVERKGTRAIAGDAEPSTEVGRGAGAYRAATAKRPATVRKTLRLDASLVERFEAMESRGDAPPMTRLVERWLRSYLDGPGQPAEDGPGQPWLP
jgi:hypothetical protein